MGADFYSMNPREITFKVEGNILTPKELFEKMYIGLEDLIEDNLRSKLNSRLRKLTDFETEKAINDFQKRRNKLIKGKWQDKINSLSSTAKVKFDDGSSQVYEIKPRFNFDPMHVLKRPNVIFLESSVGNVAVLREARKYDFDSFVKKIMYHSFGSKFDAEKTKQFYLSKNEFATPSKKKLMIIPEPNLLCALERMYRCEDIKRISPRFKVIDNDDNSMWFIRNNLPLAIDVQFNPIEYAKYFSLVQQLGFLEFLDRQLVHYCSVYGNTLGNYDLDFMIHTKNKNYMISDFKDLKSVYDSEGETYKIHVPDEHFMIPFKNEVRRLKEELDKQKINDETIFKYLDTNLRTNDVPRLDGC